MNEWERNLLIEIRNELESVSNELIQQRVIMEHVWNEVKNQLSVTDAVSENFLPQYFSKTERPALVPLKPVIHDIGEKK